MKEEVLKLIATLPSVEPFHIYETARKDEYSVT